jgi:hypothetical protein
LYKRTILLVLIALFLAGNNAFAASRTLQLPIGGNFTDAFGGTGSFTGQFALIEFAAENNQILAKGFVSGILTDSRGRVVGSVMKDVSVPVTVSSGEPSIGRVASLSVGALATCPILHLDLGPLHLNVLGLRVDLAEVILDISAESGPGNLLGNLLCAIVHLLDGGGSMATLANLLNQVLQAVTNLLA